MKLTENKSNKLQLLLALFLLLIGLLGGIIASISYARPGISGQDFSFIQWRPIHVSSVILFIIISAQTFIHIFIYKNTGVGENIYIKLIRLIVLFICLVLMYYHYAHKEFGGREYWEFPKYLSGMFFAVWLLHLVGLLSRIKLFDPGLVYNWMWLTGSIFLVIIFAENYFWIFPQFHTTAIRDLLVQWKSAGSLVGAWNQMIYGLGICIMAKVTGNAGPAKNKTAFILYILGSANLMFNWGHHIYTLPVSQFIRIISYAISMTEWIIFFRIMVFWPGRKEMFVVQKNGLAGFFLFSADIWVACNLLLALLMSIPALNIFTHGTHITVAHSMGTTIGINTMILLGTGFYLFHSTKSPGYLNILFFLLQFFLLVFWITLIAAGIKKAIWLHAKPQIPFHQLMQSLHIHFLVFAVAGFFLALCIAIFVFHLIRKIMLEKSH